jgi:hypothetical protein
MRSNENGKRAVAAKLRSCIETLLTNDRELFTLNTREETIAHKLAEYLTPPFSNWDVDCEYTMLMIKLKELVPQSKAFSGGLLRC